MSMTEEIQQKSSEHEQYTIMLETTLFDLWKVINKVGSREPTDVEDEIYCILNTVTTKVEKDTFSRVKSLSC